MRRRLETRFQPLAPTPVFLWRLVWSSIAGLAFIAASLAIGMAGYHGYEGLPWIDAFLNASMLLSGMGPLEQPQTHGGKLFAGFYALYSGLAVIVVAGIIFGPVIHRFLHRFHVDEDDS